MAFVVDDNCIKCKYTDCVEVCPVDCFREGENMLVIDPEECIDCSLCVPECPIDAIHAEDELPPEQAHMLAVNEEYAKLWPGITSKRSAPPDAAEWEYKLAKYPEHFSPLPNKQINE